MSLCQRHHDERENQPHTVVPDGQTDLRERAERLLATGADEIERALSQDSVAFLAGNRQKEGE